MKKLLALALTLVMTLGLVGPVLAAEKKDAVQLMEELGVFGEYIDRTPREQVEYFCERAQEYKISYPEDWAGFDAEVYLASEPDKFLSKEEYIATADIRTEEEFADSVFYWYIVETYNPDDVVLITDPDYTFDPIEPLPERWWMDDVPPAEPTLTLYVNGVATDVEVIAGEGVTYADADALRQFFGPQAVPETAIGLLPIRETVQKAGWDVGWYSNRWSGEQEVQLWDKAAYESYLVEEFGPLNDFLTKAVKASGNALFAETPTTTHETVNVELTRFSTLDGDKTYPLTLEADMTLGGGILDMTVTFDVSELLKAFPADALESVTKLGGFSVTQLRQFLKAGVAEFIIDYNTGDMAYNIPLLALVDEDLAGWQSESFSGADGLTQVLEEMEALSLTSTLYAQMTSTASYAGAEYGLDSYESLTQMLALFAGKERFTVHNGKTTYTLTTRAMNEALSALINAEPDEDGELDRIARPVYSFFKAFDVTYTLDEVGNVTADLHIRPDMDGIASTIAKAYESSYYGDPSASGVIEIVMGLALKGYDMDLTASSQGSAARSTGSMELHWNNVGKLTVRTTATQTGGKTPRSIDDIVK